MRGTLLTTRAILLSAESKMAARILLFVKHFSEILQKKAAPQSSFFVVLFPSPYLSDIVYLRLVFLCFMRLSGYLFHLKRVFALMYFFKRLIIFAAAYLGIV